MEIHPGDIYWIALAGAPGAEPGIAHPHVVVQVQAHHRSRIDAVIVCALTTNRKRASLPGNVLLEPGEANLPRRSVVEVSKLSTVDKAALGKFIGSLNRARIDQILAGIRFVERLMAPGAMDGER